MRTVESWTVFFFSVEQMLIQVWYVTADSAEG